MGIESYSHSQVVHAHGLPSLPFELQICILSQVSIHQIFALRRVSRAWHSMLSNPNLESVLMDLYPFLTSAPTLAALAKRRLRILRNEPVAIIQRLHRGDSHFAVTLLQGGYDVQIWCTVFIGNNTFRRQLIIKDWNRGGKLIAQLDLLKVLEAEFPEIYTKYVGDPLRPKRGAQVLVRHPQIHGGILMVVLQFAYVSERIGMV